MLKSMTAYGRSVVEKSFGRLTAEIRSVNSRFLEIDVVLPHGYLHLEDAVRKQVAKYISRGKVKIMIAFHATSSPVKIIPNLPLAKELKSAYEKIQEELGYKKDELDLNLFLQQKDLLQYEVISEDEQYVKTLENILDDALRQMVVMKEREGKQLQEDIEKRLGNLKSLLEKIKNKSSDITLHYQEKLTKLLKESFPTELDNEDRILREVALLADKADVEEEITRFYSHLAQFDKFLVSDKKSIGKTIDFLVQEMLRELNTIGSKTMNVEVSHYVVEMKSELERIREQIQNV